jgi:hypothetical protein
VLQMKEKLYFLFLIFSLTACTTYDYLLSSQVPTVVKSRLQKEYVGVKNLRWFFENERYVAKFRRAKYDYLFIFDKQGNLLQRNEEVSLQTLPMPIKQKILQTYPQYKLREAVLQVRNKDTVYMTEIQRGMKFYYLAFNTQAKMQGREVLLLEDKELVWDFGFLKGM